MSKQKKALQISSDNWDEAHELIQSDFDKLSCLVHAYLHRLEGDKSNASYWYRRAGEPFPKNTLSEEYERLISKS